MCQNLQIRLTYCVQELLIFNDFYRESIRSKNELMLLNKLQVVPVAFLGEKMIKTSRKMTETIIGESGYRSRYLSHAKRALYHLSYICNSPHEPKIVVIVYISSLLYTNTCINLTQ